MDYTKIDFLKFVDDTLAGFGFRMIDADEEFVSSRLEELKNFMNEILEEYAVEYGWVPVDKNYILNPLVDKWKYSHAVLNERNEICFISFASVYDDHLHLHCCYARKDSRGLNFSKHCMIKLCQKGIENGFIEMDAYWPKKNSGSIILFLKLGWQIEDIRNNKEVFMIADLAEVRNRAYNLLSRGK